MLTIALTIALAIGTPAPVLLTEGRPPATPLLGELGIHIARPGETLFSVSLRYHMTVPNLARLNGTTTRGILLPGRPLWVPLANAINARAGSPAEGPSGAALPTQAAAAEAPTEAATAATASTGELGTTVQAGDTLYAISRRAGVDVEDLKRWNGLPADGSIRVGQTLLLQGDAAPAATSVAAVDTGAADPATSDTRIDTPIDTTYAVAPGDTLSAIAGRFQTTIAALKAQNGLAGDTITVGQVLTVSGTGAGLGPVAGSGAKRIEVDVGDQQMTVWQGDTLVWQFTVSTGLPRTPTRRGSFAVQSKIPDAWSGPWQLWMPNWLGIYWAGGSENGIHALPILNNGQHLWAGYLGSPISYGCVVLGTADAEQLYDWAELGTPVEIHD